MSLFFVTAPGLEAVAAEEARRFDFADARPVPGGVEASGELADGMRACLHLAIPTTVRLKLGTVRAGSWSELKKGLSDLALSPYVSAEGTLEASASAKKARLKHTGRILQTLAEATKRTVDDGTGGIFLRVTKSDCEVSVDLAGERLHRRGWRLEGGPAPLRETLAAGLLALAGWDGTTPFADPMCGSGTLAIEAARRASRMAPGQTRAFAFEAFPSFDADAWSELKERALAAVRPCPVPVLASDQKGGQLGVARRNAERAGVLEALTLERLDVAEARAPEGCPPGLVLVNPPYGRRLDAPLIDLYRRIGRGLGAGFPGWKVAIFTPRPELAEATGLELDDGVRLRNGGLKVQLYQGRIPS